MINKYLVFKSNRIGFVLGAVLLAALTEGAGRADGQTIKIILPPPPMVVVQPPVVVAPPAVAVEDDYVYYPSYGMYFNSSRHQYLYMNGGAWVTAATPYGVSTEVLMASPSVRMDFHDSPEHHHAEMLQKYPKNWTRDPHHDDQDHHDQDHQDHQDQDHHDGDNKDRK